MPGSHATTPARGLTDTGTQRGQRRTQAAESPRASRRSSFIGFKKQKTFAARQPQVPAPRRWPAGRRSLWLQWRLVRAILWRTDDHVSPSSPTKVQPRSRPSCLSSSLPLILLPLEPLSALHRPYLHPGPLLREGCCPLVLEQKWGMEGQRLQIPGCGWCSPGDFHPREIQWARSTGWDQAPGGPQLQKQG